MSVEVKHTCVETWVFAPMPEQPLRQKMIPVLSFARLLFLYYLIACVRSATDFVLSSVPSVVS